MLKDIKISICNINISQLLIITICVWHRGIISQKRELITWRNVKYERCNGESTTTIRFLFTSVLGFTNVKLVISRTSCGCLALKCIRLLVDKVTDVYTICDTGKSSKMNRKHNDAILDNNMCQFVTDWLIVLIFRIIIVEFRIVY